MKLTFENMAICEELTMQAESLASLAVVITTAMFDAESEAVDCENAMRYFTTSLLAFSTKMDATYLETKKEKEKAA